MRVYAFDTYIANFSEYGAKTPHVFTKNEFQNFKNIFKNQII